MTEKTDSERIAELERKNEELHDAINRLQGEATAHLLALIAFAQTSAVAPRIAALLGASVECVLAEGDDDPLRAAFVDALTYEAASILGALEQPAPPNQPGPSGPTGD
ncbi:hypothetical protein [Burkholderia gladioli]|uniref:hypothetical protein n=1 Tax=Burkholderia gladioli TaxID=28095 RepID=UPI001C5E5295|nr:hypothetical protein [Burkholderia gladioli]MBW5285966.1 hypothetical protein [Burkholderia gladioli]